MGTMTDRLRRIDKINKIQKNNVKELAAVVDELKELVATITKTKSNGNGSEEEHETKLGKKKKPCMTLPEVRKKRKVTVDEMAERLGDYLHTKYPQYYKKCNSKRGPIWAALPAEGKIVGSVLLTSVLNLLVSKGRQYVETSTLKRAPERLQEIRKAINKLYDVRVKFE